ncbi:potassium-transporting ATPase subunit C [Actinokineospora auranticolor]|uniref:Potassium-transporting ATPase KdpC subunit n=1 Tax=Actinokineospora auranticolor TaxID=155976 RepID=A0A2S6GDT1_9PSEU|nr:potassium-transporting ATPase subunit C [Actinokineospora auranticolor]PPK63236.1 K+-transporting ATPase ATPase C chain [Actinokineospora auranticolor]
MKNLLKQTGAGLRVLLVLTVIIGVLYPTAVWAVSRLPGLRANAEAVDTTLVAVPRDGDRWFQPRPSAATLPASGGSNKSEVNADYDTVVAERRAAVAQREGVSPDRVPQDAVTASASGLDPHISDAYAQLQVPRVARANGLSENAVRALVAEHTEGRGLGILGDPGVNVTALNRVLDAAR